MRESATRPEALAASDTVTLEQLSEGLSGAGLSMVAVRSVPGARLEIEARDLEIIVLDLTVFGPNGLGLLRWLRERPDKAGIPILVLTGRDRSDQIAAGLRAGATAYTTKPLDLPVLEACAESLRRQAAILRGARRERELLAELAAVEAQLSRTVEQQEALSRHTPQGVEAARNSGELFRAPTLERPVVRSGSWRTAQPRDTAELVSVDWVLFQALEGALSRCMETQQPLSVLMIEAQALDPLAAGEGAAFLAAFAKRVTAILGDAEALKPIAGRTFCAVLPDADNLAVRQVAERVLLGLQVSPLRVAGEDRRASACLGAASLRPDLAGSPLRLVDRAHTALARAKESPRGYWIHEDAPVHEAE